MFRRFGGKWVNLAAVTRVELLQGTGYWQIRVYLGTEWVNSSDTWNTQADAETAMQDFLLGTATVN